jgi:hypothetical protein
LKTVRFSRLFKTIGKTERLDRVIFVQVARKIKPSAANFYAAQTISSNSNTKSYIEKDIARENGNQPEREERS